MDLDHAVSIEEKFGVPSFPSIDSLLEAVEAVVIAVPSSLHKLVALQAASKNVHALVEKPLAMNSKDGQEVTQVFQTAGLKLAVGHIERFNPVVVELSKMLKQEKVYAIETRRYSAFDGRISDANVVEDLMIHDIDIVCSLLTGEPIKSISAFGIIAKSKVLDYVQSAIQFQNGVLATVAASRITENKIREIVVHTEQGYVTADLLAKSLNVSKNTSLIVDGGTKFAYKQDSLIQRIFVPMVEPLRAELFAFYDAIEGREDICVDGATGVYAISICEQIIKSATENR